MRTIKFRGIPIDEDCEWNIITGSLLVDIFGNTIIYHPLNTNLGGFRAVPVNPETVGQFTGLTDKNGVEIYENDIIKVDIFTKPYSVLFGKSEKWGACFCVQSFNSITFLTKNWANTCEVIGNVHDNPELLQ